MINGKDIFSCLKASLISLFCTYIYSCFFFNYFVLNEGVLEVKNSYRFWRWGKKIFDNSFDIYIENLTRIYTFNYIRLKKVGSKRKFWDFRNKYFCFNMGNKTLDELFNHLKENGFDVSMDKSDPNKGYFGGIKKIR